MFDLERRELVIIAVLVSLIILGVGVTAYKRSHRDIYVKVKGFDADDLKARYADELIERQKSITININEAGVEDLMRLKGIGKTLAERVVEYRSSRGRFSSISDMKNVKGIGEKLFEKIKDDISVE